MPDPSPLPPYLPAVIAAAADAPRGAVTDVFVLHSDDCPLLAGGECCCTPTVTCGYVLWFRPRRGRPWELVTTVATERAAWDAVKTSGKRNGDWLVLEAGKGEP